MIKSNRAIAGGKSRVRVKALESVSNRSAVLGFAVILIFLRYFPAKLSPRQYARISSAAGSMGSGSNPGMYLHAS